MRRNYLLLGSAICIVFLFTIVGHNIDISQRTAQTHEWSYVFSCFGRCLQHSLKVDESRRPVPLTVILSSTMKDDQQELTRRSGLRKGDSQMVYVADDTSATLTVPQNKGYEAMVYLTYLIDHYDNLPEIMVFMHAGRISWHNNALLLARADLMVNKLNITTVLRQGFVGLACDAHLQRHIGSVPNVAGISSLELTREDWFTNPQDLPRISPAEWHQRYLDLWESLFPNTLAPLTIDAPKGGQFAISRQTAMLVPKEKLSRLRDWLIATPLPSKCAGAVFEALWHLIFLGPTNSSISTQSSVCYCQLYDICPQQGSMSEEQANLVFDASIVMALRLLDSK